MGSLPGRQVLEQRLPPRSRRPGELDKSGDPDCAKALAKLICVTTEVRAGGVADSSRPDHHYRRHAAGDDDQRDGSR